MLCKSGRNPVVAPGNPTFPHFLLRRHSPYPLVTSKQLPKSALSRGVRGGPSEAYPGEVDMDALHPPFSFG
jgi:hypothetical protein